MAVEITEEFVWQNIPRRPRDSHKGTFGSVLAVAGSAFYRGAALLAAEGALRTGAGIVTTEKDAVKLTNRAKIPEEIQRGIYYLPINISFIEDSATDFLQKLEEDVRGN